MFTQTNGQFSDTITNFQPVHKHGTTVQLSFISGHPLGCEGVVGIHMYTNSLHTSEKTSLEHSEKERNREKQTI